MALETPALDADTLAAMDAAAAQSASAPASGLSAQTLSDIDKAAEQSASHEHNDAHERRQSQHNPAPTRTKAAPTRFQQARTPVPDPELSWGETGKQALHNFLPSLGGVGKSVGEAVLHPGQTLSGIRDLGAGALSQGAGAIGLQQDPERKAQTERVVRALEDHYKQSYGSVKGFKQAVAKDPASVLLDASVVIPGLGEAGASATGVKALSTVGKAARYMDPVAGALKVAALPLTGAKIAGKTIPGVARAIPYVQSATSGASAHALRDAAQAGASSDSVVRKAFESHMSGKAPAAEIPDALHAAISDHAKAGMSQFRSGMGTLNSRSGLPPMDWSVADTALSNARNTRGARPLPGGGVSMIDPDVMQALGDAEARITQARMQPAGAQNWELMHDAKRAIGTDMKKLPRYSNARGATQEVYDALQNEIIRNHPSYKTMIGDYSDLMDELTQMRHTFGKPGSSDETVLRKALRSRDSLSGKPLLETLAAYDRRIPAMLAGHELNPVIPGGTQGVVRMVGNALASPATFGVNPLLTAGHIAAASPRAMGSLNNASGKLYRLGAGPSKLRAGAYYAGRAGQEEDRVPEHRDLGALAAPPTSSDVDALTRMIIGEAGSEPDEGKAAAAHVALNRAKESGQSLSEIINAPHQFEAVGNGSTADIDPNSEEYQRVLNEIVLPALAGDLEDPTGGMTHFINADLQRQMGRAIPQWAQGSDGLKIGRHTFFPGEQRMARASGGKVDVGAMADALIAKADRVKNAVNRTTEPLLRQHDSVVAQALHIAGQAI